MKTIFNYKPSPFEVILLTGHAWDQARYLSGLPDSRQCTIDLFRLFLIRRDLHGARQILQRLDAETRSRLEARELSPIELSLREQV